MARACARGGSRRHPRPFAVVVVVAFAFVFAVAFVVAFAFAVAFVVAFAVAFVVAFAFAVAVAFAVAAQAAAVSENSRLNTFPVAVASFATSRGAPSATTRPPSSPPSGPSSITCSAEAMTEG